MAVVNKNKEIMFYLEEFGTTLEVSVTDKYMDKKLVNITMMEEHSKKFNTFSFEFYKRNVSYRNDDDLDKLKKFNVVLEELIEDIENGKI